MKKLLLFLCFVVLVLFCIKLGLRNKPKAPEIPKEEACAPLSAADSLHLFFKGAPLTGSLQQFIARMQTCGFTLCDNKDGTAILSGDFAGYQNCTVVVYTLQTQDVVNTIVVLFPQRENWSLLKDDYMILKKMLTKKYGKPAKVTEKFEGYQSGMEDDGDRFHNVTSDRCKYISEFDTPKGEIVLSIDHQDFSECYVMLRYYDRLNSEVIRKQALEDL